MTIRKEISDLIRAVDALLVGITRQDFSDDEFEAVKYLTERIESTILVCHNQEGAPPSELSH
jgi:hypothetical protein